MVRYAVAPLTWNPAINSALALVRGIAFSAWRSCLKPWSLALPLGSAF